MQFKALFRFGVIQRVQFNCASRYSLAGFAFFLCTNFDCTIFVLCAGNLKHKHKQQQQHLHFEGIVGWRTHSLAEWKTF